MKSGHAYLAPLILFLFSLLLRISLVSQGAYNIDVVDITVQAEKFLRDGQLNYVIGFGFPLAIILASFFVFLGQIFSAPDSIAAVNYMGVIFGALCVPVFYCLIERLTDKPSAFIGAILLSLCPVFLGYSLIGLTHTPALFFQLLAMLQAAAFVQDNKKRRLAFSGIAFGFLGAVRFQDMALMVPALAYMFLFLEKANDGKDLLKKRLINLSVFAAIAGLTTLLFYLPYLWGHLRSSYIAQLNFYQRVSLVYLDPAFFVSALVHNIKLLVMTLSMPGFILALASMSLLFRQKRRLFWLFMIWIGVPMLLFSNLFTIAPRHQILIIPAFIALECYTLGRFLLFNIWIRLAAILVFFLIVYSGFIHYLPIFVYRHHHSIITAYSRWLGQVTEKNAHIIATDLSHFIKRYAQRRPGVRTLQSRHLYTREELKSYQKNLEMLLDQGVPVYITETGLYTYNIEKRFSNFMEENFELNYVGTYPYEDWHRGYLFVDIANNGLFKIGKKQ